MLGFGFEYTDMSPQPPKPQTNGVHSFEKPLFGAVPCVRDPNHTILPGG